MKVIIPVIDNQSGRNSIAAGFHNAEYVCIYDPVNESCDWMRTKELNFNTGKFSQELKDRQISAVISRSMPLMALGIFTGNGLKVMKALGDSLSDNIWLFQNNQLELITSQTSQKMSSCGGSCNSCNSNCN